MSIRSPRAFFEGYAHDFDAIYAGHRGLLRRLFNRLLRRSMFLRYRLTLEGCNPVTGSTVLDVGCGPGHYALALAVAGAARVTGLDVAPAMIALANGRARAGGVGEHCEFICADFTEWEPEVTFDYVILTGFMDYVSAPRPVIERALSLTRRRAFFSFPINSGFLAWQRRLRYRRRTPLYLYSRADLERLFADLPGWSIDIQRIARDYFVTAARNSDKL